MLFHSASFLLFFPVVTAAYFLVSHRLRWIVLLVASYVFYMAWNPAFALLILTSTLVDYIAALFIHQSTGRKKNLWLAASLITNLGLLGYFKYANFFVESMTTALSALGISVMLPQLNILLPVGISFYTFQTLSYTIDVYKGVRKPERHLGIFALYVSFFPQLVAGPIERSTHLLPQFYAKHRLDICRIRDGLSLMLWGFFKKLVIADNLAVVVDTVYSDPTRFEGLPLIVATVFFAFQIYCDFSGYSDIAIGAAQVLGFSLMDNFNRPYSAVSLQDFWRRWHISLMTWFRDYIYVPLGGSRVSRLFQVRNVLIVFFISGIWHGAAWTFVAWGVYHGVLMIVLLLTKSMRSRVSTALGLNRIPVYSRMLSVTTTFLVVCLGWVLFRASSFGDAFYIYAHMLTGLGSQLSDFTSLKGALGHLSVSKTMFVSLCLSIVFLEEVHRWRKHDQMRAMFAGWPRLARWSFSYALIIAILFLGRWSSEEFIYFQF